jgi:hypothetical protein
MKRLIIVTVVGLLSVQSVWGQAEEAKSLALNLAKLEQLRKILDNMYKGYKILTDGYQTIKNIAEGNFKLHQVFLDGLYAVNPAVRKYKRIPLIIEYQLLLVEEHKRAYRRFSQDRNFSEKELNYIRGVYGYIIDRSLKNLEELVMIVTANKLRMTDEERLQAIDRLYNEMENKIAFLRHFNNGTQLLAIQRAKERRDVEVLQKIYDVN